MAYETSIKKDQNQPILHDFSTIISRYDILGGGIHGKTSKVDQLVSILVEYIKTNDLRAGTKLTNERDLGKILNVSSRSLREALITLSTLGLLEAKHGSGWYVGKFDPVKSMRLMAPILQGFWQSNWEDIMYSRLAVESITSYLAAKNIDPDGTVTLEEALQSMEKAYLNNRPNDYRHFDRLFHQIIAEKCGNSILAMQSSMMTGLYYHMTWWTPEEEMARTFKGHQTIFFAIRDRKPKEARQAMEDHLLFGLEWFGVHVKTADSDAERKGM
jgi:GntR family transcriptional repressor for pyruvate dehydrogenase complex